MKQKTKNEVENGNNGESLLENNTAMLMQIINTIISISNAMVNLENKIHKSLDLNEVLTKSVQLNEKHINILESKLNGK